MLHVPSLGNETVFRRLLDHQHVQHPHRGIHLRHPWWQDYVEDVRLWWSKTSMSSDLMGGIQAFAENQCMSMMTLDIIFLSMQPHRSTLPIFFDPPIQLKSNHHAFLGKS